MPARSLKSICTLADLVGPGHRVVPRASDRRCRWLPQDVIVRDGLSSSIDALFGRIPSLVSAATCTPRVRRLLLSAGLDIPEETETFVDAGDYGRRLAEFTATGRIFVQHVYPEDELPAERYWIPPELLSYLNNKANLGDLVPPAATPARRLLTRQMFERAAPESNCVIKVATDDSTGGGRDVAICRSTGDWSMALKRFADVERVVIEDLLSIEKNWCLSFGVATGGRVEYLGAAEQSSLPDGLFDGNWIGGSEPSQEAISSAREAVMCAATMGYSGFVGIDVGLTTDGRVLVFDLNFRTNASTIPIILRESIRRTHGSPAMRISRWFFDEKQWDEAERMVEEGRLIPFRIYDPAGGPRKERRLFLIGAILGEDRTDIIEYTRQSSIFADTRDLVSS